MNYTNRSFTCCMIMYLMSRIKYLCSIHILNSNIACHKHCHKLASRVQLGMHFKCMNVCILLHNVYQYLPKWLMRTGMDINDIPRYFPSSLQRRTKQMDVTTMNCWHHRDDDANQGQQCGFCADRNHLANMVTPVKCHNLWTLWPQVETLCIWQDNLCIGH